MRLHTDTLTPRQIHAATTARGMTGVYAHVTPRSSRTRDQAYEVRLHGDSPYIAGYAGATDNAATWDEWGIFLATLFDAGPSLTVPRVYTDHEHFRWTTGARFDDLTAAGQHRRHRWEYTGEAVTGSYSVRSCECGALHRILARGLTWDDFRTADA